ncbi:CGNR zinc finger domain-containing protein [Actinomycetospora sp. C-140]
MGIEEFPRHGGRWCLDFIATFGRRHRAEPVERMVDGAALRRWLDGAGLPSPGTVSGGELDDARELREALHRLVRSHMSGGRPDDADLRLVNGAAARPDLAPRLHDDGRRSHEPGTDVSTAAVMSTLARDGIDLIASAPAERVKECEHPDCSLLFLDHTQGNRRRWCSMQRCGNQTKVADYRGRRRARPESGVPNDGTGRRPPER